jgi:3-oxoacyl-[acyl-carrier-protein] synthase-3
MQKKPYGISIIGTGHQLPEHILTNDELCKNLDVDSDWIIRKTGITRRFIAKEGDSASSLGLSAAKKAIQSAQIENKEIGLVIACTYSGDYIFPPLSAKLHHDLGITDAQIFDIQANCAGFVNGLTIAADRMLMDSDIKYALVVGVELPTRYIDSSDVETAIYLSDGAGAAILGRVEDPNLGIQGSGFFTDSSNYESVRHRGGGSSFPSAKSNNDSDARFTEMNGLATWKQAATHLPKVIRRACEKSGKSLDDVNMLLLHQANLNLIHYVVKKMTKDIAKTYTNVERIGNTGSASIPILIDEAVRNQKIKPGDNIVIAGVGAGFNFGASFWKWTL